jgi:hypothetical protein
VSGIYHPLIVFSTPHSWLDFHPDWHQFLAANNKALDLLSQAAERDSCAFDSPATRNFSNEPIVKNAKEMICLMVLSAAKLQHEDKHAEALARLGQALKARRHFEGRGSLHSLVQGTELVNIVCAALQQWSAHTHVTAAMRKQAAKLMQNHSFRIHLAAIIAVEYRKYRNSINDKAHLDSLCRDSMNAMRLSIWYWMPGESTRRNRLIDYLESRDAASIYSRNNWVKRSFLPVAYWLRDIESARSIEQQWIKHSPLLEVLNCTPVIFPAYEPFIDRHTSMNATRLIFKIHNHQISTGIMPKRIDEGEDQFDTSGSYDPWTTRKFVWKPNGIHNSLTLRYDHQQPDVVDIPMGRPFLLSGGPGCCTLYELQDRDPNVKETKYAILNKFLGSGRVFVIPELKE